MIEVFDDLFAKDFIMETKTVVERLPWQYINKANRNQYPYDSPFSKGSHTFFGTRIFESRAGFDVYNETPNILMQVINHVVFEIIQEPLDLQVIETNLQVRGQDGRNHRDLYEDERNDRTILYYPHDEWKEEWGGELKVYGDSPQSLLPLPGRVVYLDSSVEHQALGPLVDNVARMSIAYRMLRR